MYTGQSVSLSGTGYPEPEAFSRNIQEADMRKSAFITNAPEATLKKLRARGASVEGWRLADSLRKRGRGRAGAKPLP